MTGESRKHGRWVFETQVRRFGRLLYSGNRSDGYVVKFGTGSNQSEFGINPNVVFSSVIGVSSVRGGRSTQAVSSVTSQLNPKQRSRGGIGGGRRGGHGTQFDRQSLSALPEAAIAFWTEAPQGRARMSGYMYPDHRGAVVDPWDDLRGATEA